MKLERVLSAEEYDVLTETLLDGLNYDGAHHKQHYLNLALLLVVGGHKYEEIKNGSGGWEDGTAA